MSIMKALSSSKCTLFSHHSTCVCPPNCRVAQNESTNLMSPENLAIIFAPSLIRPKKSPKPQDLVKELAKAQEYVPLSLSLSLSLYHSLSLKEFTHSSPLLYHPHFPTSEYCCHCNHTPLPLTAPW